ncbi:MAG: queuosine precursor transporter [Tannerellaceae bacterium]|nr:queuosine precursor transporter [Tannerellaceae bacterium]
MQKQVSVSFMLLGILFNICLVASNLLATKVLQFAGITASAGLVVFPISYIINDCLVEVWGYRKARLIIWSGFASNFLLMAFAQIAILIPAAPFWEGEEAFAFVFGLAPRIACASLLAFLGGSFVNAWIMSRMKIASRGRRFSLRAIVSTLGGEAVDSVIFFPIAFAGLVPPGEILLMAAAEAILKSLYEVIALPLTIRIVKYMKRKEGEDAYDYGTNYNPLRMDI